MDTQGHWGCALAVLACILLWFVLTEHGRRLKEGFEEKKQEFILKKGTDVYDDFYVSVYDDLLYDELKNDFEIGTIVDSTKPTQESIILDIGSGTGHQAAALHERGFNVAGLDVSPAMVAAARKKHPGVTYRIGDALKGNTYPPSSFTHITCMYFTVYYVRNKRQFFTNCYTWLKPGGYLVLHLVDRTRFDPIVPAGSVLAVVDPQNYARERITRTKVEFDKESYTADFALDEKNDEATFTEIFRGTDTGRVRKNEHQMYMPTQKDVIQLAREAGFILVSKSTMDSCGYIDQYMYVLQKPG